MCQVEMLDKTVLVLLVLKEYDLNTESVSYSGRKRRMEHWPLVVAAVSADPASIVESIEVCLKLARYLAFSACVVQFPVLILCSHPRILELLIEKIHQPIFSHLKSNVSVLVLMICSFVLQDRTTQSGLLSLKVM